MITEEQRQQILSGRSLIESYRTQHIDVEVACCDPNTTQQEMVTLMLIKEDMHSTTIETLMQDVIALGFSSFHQLWSMSIELDTQENNQPRWR